MMVVGNEFALTPGESGLGKSTMINTLFNTSIYPPKEDKEVTQDTPKTIDIQAISAGTMENFTSRSGGKWSEIKAYCN
jgi:septin family protein